MAGTDYDVCYSDMFTKDFWYHQGWVKDVQKYERPYVKAEIFPGPYMAIHGSDGKMNSLPYFNCSFMIQMQVPMLEKAGYDAADLKNTWSMDEFEEVCIKVKDMGLSEFPINPGIFGTIYYQFWCFGTWVLGEGGDFFDANFNPIFQEERSGVPRTLDMLDRWFNDIEIADPNAIAMSAWDDLWTAYSAGRTFAYLGADYEQKFIHDPDFSSIPGDITTNARVPGKKHQSVLDCASYCMTYAPAQKGNEQEAWYIQESMGGRSPATGEFYTQRLQAIESSLFPMWAPLYKDQEVYDSFQAGATWRPWR
jgi:hypothetical protein